MQINIPKEIAFLESALKRFVDAMVFKLRKNVHKGRWEDYLLVDALTLLKKEVVELETAINEGNDVEVLLESADIANFAMIAAALAIEDAQPKRSAFAPLENR